jgi:3-dehydro-L-gulonate 2-dehydrogenase
MTNTEVQNPVIIVSAQEMQQTFSNALLKHGLEPPKAVQLADVFTNNTLDGIYTHGVYRFPRFIQYIKKGLIDIEAEPSLAGQFGAIEQWNGNLGPGPLNAMHATERAMKISREFGIGCVALANTNHWMRGGSYGWQAAKAGYVFIGWTNTTAIMPAWGAIDSKLGNNPLVLALPYKDEAIVLDMAMSQYSYGAMELSQLKGEQLSVIGGYDAAGQMTNDPTAILASRRPIPIGFWKGAGLSLLLDILAAILSGGMSVHEIAKKEGECSLSQVFIAIDINKLSSSSAITQSLDNIISDYHNSAPEDKKKITFPGERVLQTRKSNLRNGISILKKVWDEIGQL